MNQIKAAWIVFWWATASLILFLPIALAGIVDRSGRLAFRLCQVWTWWATVIAGVRVEVAPNPRVDPRRSYVIVSNHQSLFDIPALMLGLGLPFRWVIKRAFGYVPLFGWALWLAGHVFIDRSTPKRSLKTMDDAARRLPAGVSIAVFPEGTRSDDGRLRKFKAGGFLLAAANGLPILPVTVNGSWRVMPDKRSLAFRPGPIQVAVGDPIETASGGGRRVDALSETAPGDRGQVEALIERTRAAIEARLDPDYPGGPGCRN